jgi:hypothetical protein
MPFDYTAARHHERTEGDEEDRMTASRVEYGATHVAEQRDLRRSHGRAIR